MSKLQKNTYVTKLITATLFKLLEEKDLGDISISEITDQAVVSRCSFYRNYKNKEDIISEDIYCQIVTWQKSFEEKASQNLEYRNERAMWKDLFRFLKENKNYFMLLEKRNLLYLLEEVICNLCGAKQEQPDSLAYFSAFVARGIFGWIAEWLKRGANDEHTSDVMDYLNTFPTW
jgi:Transcriptional regulator